MSFQPVMNCHRTICIYNAKLYMSEWLLFNTKLNAIFQIYYGENALHFNEMLMILTLYLTNMLSWIFIASLQKKHFVSRYVSPLRQIIRILSLQFLLILLNAIYIINGAVANINFIVFGLCSNSRSTMLEASMLTITPQMLIK